MICSEGLNVKYKRVTVPKKENSLIPIHSDKHHLGWYRCFSYYLFIVSARLMSPPAEYLHTSDINVGNEANDITSTRWRNGLMWCILLVIWQYLEASPASDSHFLPVIFNQHFLPKIKESLHHDDYDQQSDAAAGLQHSGYLFMYYLNSGVAFFFIIISVWQHRQHQYFGLEIDAVIRRN